MVFMNELWKPDYPVACEAGSEERSILARLTRSKKRLESELAKVDAALEGLDKNPQVAELLEKVMKAL
jgi:hypothetical protein